MDHPESSTSPHVDILQCSLCDKHSPISDLRQVVTMKLGQMLRNCAASLQNEQLAMLLHKISNTIQLGWRYFTIERERLWDKKMKVILRMPH